MRRSICDEGQGWGVIDNRIILKTLGAQLPRNCALTCARAGCKHSHGHTVTFGSWLTGR
jgi:hypothetical protein